MHSSELLAQLGQFTGSETFTRHGLARSVLMTEGVVFLADKAGAHWLTDAVVSYLHEARVRAEEFQVWKLTVDRSSQTALLAMSDGNSQQALVSQRIEYTDFPLDEITLWLVVSGDHRVLMLPQEY